MKLLCVKDVITTDSKTNKQRECFTRDKFYKSRFFRTGMELYAINNFEEMHMVANGNSKNETLDDWWFHNHFKIIDENNNDW